MPEPKFTQEALDQIDQYSRDRVGISTLERYTGSVAAEFQSFILLTNFRHYVDVLEGRFGGQVRQGSVMQACHMKGEGISLINYSVGSPTAALVVELLSFIKPKGVLMLGMCGGLRDEHQVGDFFNPVAAIRGEGTSDAYMPRQSPSLSSFVIQRFVCEALERKKLFYHTGVIHTTNVRFWEFNDAFKKTLTEERAQAIDMECATLFTVGFARYVPVGALMLISDTPLKAKGVKTASSAKAVFEKYTGVHIEVGLQVMADMRAKEKEKEDLGYKF